MTESFDHVVGQVRTTPSSRLDPEGIIQTWNLGAERVKGYTAEEADRPQLRDVLQRGGSPQRSALQAPRRGADAGRVEDQGWRIRKDGTRFWGDVVITALHDDTATSPDTPR